MVDAKELLELLAKALVDLPDEVEVTTIDEDDETVLELRVAPDDVGKVIGKQGRTVRAIRDLVDAAGEKFDRQFAVEVIE
ncbi:MAG: KH domain-containing protein [Acidobacteriota bacterium]